MKTGKLILAMTILGLYCANIQADEVQRWLDAGFKNVSISKIDLSLIYQGQMSDSPTHGLSLVSVVFQKSGWLPEDLTFRTQDLADTLIQCGIKLTESKVISVESIPGLERFDGQVRVGPELLDDPFKKEAQIANMLPEKNRPVLFFVKAIANDYAYANLAESEPTGYQTTQVVDTIWISRATTFSEHKYNSHYSVEAHELGHVLGKLPHLYLPKLPGPMTNLMAADLYKVSPTLNTAQCEKMRQSKLLSRF